MQRRELVPIREALGDLDGPAKAIRDAPPPGASLQGPHRLMALFTGDSFTRAD